MGYSPPPSRSHSDHSSRPSALVYTEDFSTFCQQLTAQQPQINLAMIKAAHRLAVEAHGDQARRSGEPYITHPVAVASLLARVNCPETVLCAALLHDTVEDATVPARMRRRIRNACGPGVLGLVEAVSKDRRLAGARAQIEAVLDTMRIEHDPDVLFLKLADLIHNVATLAGLQGKRRQRWVAELNQDYFPLLLQQYHHLPSDRQADYMVLLGALADCREHQRASSEESSILVYEGKEGIKAIYEDILATLARQRGSKEVYTWTDFEEKSELLGADFIDDYAKRRKTAGIVIRAIKPKTAKAIRDQASAHRKSIVRLVQGLQLPGEIRIYGDKVAFITFAQNHPVGFVIEGPKIRAMMTSIFSESWKQAD